MAYPTQYDINKFVQGINGFGLYFCTLNYSAKIAATTDTTLTIPGISAVGNWNATLDPQYIAIFSYAPSVEMWVALNNTAAVPAGGTFASTNSCLNPEARIVKQGDVIHFYSTAGGDVGIQLYTLQQG